MTRIVGIDPGSRATGYGVIDFVGGKARYVASGVIRLATSPMPDRLKIIFGEISELIEQHKPEESAIEQVFMARDPAAALKLGQARGAAAVALRLRMSVVAEYSARQIKQAVVGTGAAAKPQVEHMVKALLNIAGDMQADAADALAVALCHGHMRQTQQRVGSAVSRVRGGRWR
jgi:crossover junction endodeoxyribonuclease RuvC